MSSLESLTHLYLMNFSSIGLDSLPYYLFPTYIFYFTFLHACFSFEKSSFLLLFYKSHFLILSWVGSVSPTCVPAHIALISQDRRRLPRSPTARLSHTALTPFPAPLPRSQQQCLGSSFWVIVGLQSLDFPVAQVSCHSWISFSHLSTSKSVFNAEP